MTRGRNEEQPFLDFYNAVEQSRALGAQELSAVISTHAKGHTILKTKIKDDGNGNIEETLEETIKNDPRAAEWLLERLYPELYHRQAVAQAPTLDQAIELVCKELAEGTPHVVEKILASLPPLPGEEEPEEPTSANIDLN